jgi:DNA sulfur modification protein DndB
MKVSFPAMKGAIGQREYYSCMMKMSVVPKMFTFRDWAEFTPEEREQRILNEKRIPQMAKYILDNEEGYLFSSITASYKCDVTFKPNGDDGLGMLEMDFQNAEFVINDGQHRCAAIAKAIKENPQLGDETLSVLLFPYENRDRMQQMFSDLNRYGQNTSKSLNILYDKRDPMSRLTLDTIRLVDVFDGMVDRDAISIGIRSPKLFSLSSIYEANNELLKFHDIAGLSADDDGENAPPSELAALSVTFWKAVADHMPSWRAVRDGGMKAMELRQESIASHATILRAIGSAGAELMKDYPSDWSQRLEKLTDIDWRKSNPEWEGVVVVAGSVASNRQARQATKAYVKRKLGLPLSDAEAKSLTSADDLIASKAVA